MKQTGQVVRCITKIQKTQKARKATVVAAQVPMPKTMSQETHSHALASTPSLKVIAGQGAEEMFSTSF